MKKFIILTALIFCSLITFGQTFFSKGFISNGNGVFRNNAVIQLGDFYLVYDADSMWIEKPFGTWFAKVTTPQVSVDCEDLHADITATNDGVLDCNNPTVQLTGSSNQAGVTYQWDGSVSGDLGATNPLIHYMSETVTLTITNGTTGCQSTADYIIAQDYVQPALEKFILSPNIGSDVALGVFVTNQLSGREYDYSWAGTGIVTNSSAQIIRVNEAGSFTATVVDKNNGCNENALVTVVSGDFETSGATVPVPSGIQGDILYHNGTDWVVLNAGTDGDLLQSQGSGANPQWVTPEEIPYGYNVQVYAEGTAYNMTATNALFDFGTTDPSITITIAGTYKITSGFYFDYSGATFAGNETLTAKLRRTNNTAADITNSQTPDITLDIVTTFTGGGAYIQLPPIYYTTVNTDDILQLWGGLSTIPSAGNIRITDAWINIERIY